MAFAAVGKDPGRRFSEAEKAAIGAEICELLARGVPLAEICRREDMPSPWTVSLWADANPELASGIARARDAGFDQIALDALKISDGKLPVVSDDGTPHPVDTSRDKLRAEIRLKLLAKWNPKKYGEGMQLRHANADGSGDQPNANAPLVAELRTLLSGSGKGAEGDK